MKRLIVGAAIAVIAAISYVAISADAADRPAGVSAKNWISINASIGVVLVASEVPVVKPMQGSPNGTALLLKPAAGGYFMVKGASGWHRLVVVEPLKGPADAG
ncbi:MAG: hypothetical protein ABI616_11705 [Pseudomonadota bacterium]